jgi:hypothetical protein
MGSNAPLSASAATRQIRRVAGACLNGEVAPKADRGRSTPRRRLLGERHPEPRARVRPVRLKLLSRQADDALLRLQFAIIIAPGNLRPCRGQSYVAVFGLLLPDRTWMVCIWRKTSHRERGSGR